MPAFGFGPETPARKAKLILVIPAIAGLVSEKLVANQTLVYKDAQFYITSVAVLLLAFCFAVIYNPVADQELIGEMNRLIAAVPFLLYGLYIFLQFQDVQDERKKKSDPPPEDASPTRDWLKLLLSLANVLGSNIFDLLVAVPVGILIAGSAPIDFKVAAPMMGFLTLATILLFTMMRTSLRLRRSECWSLLGLYVLFIAWMVLETVGITSVIR